MLPIRVVISRPLSPRPAAVVVSLVEDHSASNCQFPVVFPWAGFGGVASSSSRIVADVDILPLKGPSSCRLPGS